MTIKDIHINQLAIIVAGLVAQGVTFEARPAHETSQFWNITLLGGY